jgi:hypothetical protein
VSRDGGRKQNTDLYGLSFWRSHWLNCKDCMRKKKKKQFNLQYHTGLSDLCQVLTRVGLTLTSWVYPVRDSVPCLRKEFQNTPSLLTDVVHATSNRKDVYHQLRVLYYVCFLTLALAMNVFKQYTTPYLLVLAAAITRVLFRGYSHAFPLHFPSLWYKSPDLDALCCCIGCRKRGGMRLYGTGWPSLAERSYPVRENLLTVQELRGERADTHTHGMRPHKFNFY